MPEESEEEEHTPTFTEINQRLSERGLRLQFRLIQRPKLPDTVPCPRCRKPTMELLVLPLGLDAVCAACFLESYGWKRPEKKGASE